MLEKAELTLISMLSKTKKVITTPPPVLCSVASCKLFYSTVERVGTLSLLFVPPAEGGGMEISMKDFQEKIEKIGVIPVIVIDEAKNAEPLAEALVAGGLPCAEITFRTQAAEESIRIMTQKYPEMIVGAGTVLNVEQVERAMNAGARFIVCPGFDSKVVDYCLERKIPVLPGCVTPSEIMQAIACGLKMVKFFPAVQFGGVAMIKALAAPYNEMKFVPTGGVNKENLKEFLSYKAVAACGGSWMVKREWIQNGEFDRIRSLVIEAAKLKGEIRSENRNEKRR